MFSIQGVESYDFDSNKWNSEAIEQYAGNCGKTKLILYIIFS